MKFHEISCNVYFYTLGLKIGLDVWSKYSKSPRARMRLPHLPKERAMLRNKRSYGRIAIRPNRAHRRFPTDAIHSKKSDSSPDLVGIRMTFPFLGWVPIKRRCSETRVLVRRVSDPSQKRADRRYAKRRLRREKRKEYAISSYISVFCRKRPVRGNRC